MSEASFDMVLEELRDTAPGAPERLRNLVTSLPAAQQRRSIRLRPALSAAIALVIAVGVGAAVISGLSGSSPHRNVARFAPARDTGAATAQRPSTELGPVGKQLRAAPTLGAALRLQRFDVSMQLRVQDLSAATQRAVRTTRRLGGYVATADYATATSVGESRLGLRVPIQNVQRAIAQFTDLGTLVSQHISVKDLQARVDSIERRLAAERKVIAELEAKETRTPAEQALLDKARRSAKRLSLNRAGVVSEARYAKVFLTLTTEKPAAKDEEPGRFESFWGDAGDILGKEAIGVLYALVIVGPFAILAALAFFAERARRRRADHRLLEETG
jgi:Domain of unknown function (DUF4349)